MKYFNAEHSMLTAASAATLILLLSIFQPVQGQMANYEAELMPPVLTALEAGEVSTAAVDAAVWDQFSARLVEAIQGDNDSFRAAALRLVIQYEQNVDVNDARLDLVRLYRDHKNERMRRMAVVAIGASGNEWAIEFLRRSLRFEKTAAIKHTMASVLVDHDALPTGPALQTGSW